MKRLLKWLIVVVVAIGLGIGGYFYYQHSEQYPSTDDAYVKADVVKVAPQVTGKVTAVPVSDQQTVQKGQILFRIDPRPFRYREKSAEAQLALARQTVQAEQSAVQAAQAEVADRQAQLTDARSNFKRVKPLVERHVQSRSSLDSARARLDSAKANVHLAKAKLTQARMELGQAGARNQRIQQAQAQLDQAQLDLSHTTIRAPCDGWVSSVKLHRGDLVNSGDAQFALVCNRWFWVYANFKETDLTRIRPGQVATIAADMYPGHSFHGIVESVNPASGTAFSLLPPENATGNWVKVTQRVPVRVLVVDDPARYPLRVQTSAEVTIDTGAGQTPAGRARGQGLSNTEAVALAERKGLVPKGLRDTPGDQEAVARNDPQGGSAAAR